MKITAAVLALRAASPTSSSSAVKSTSSIAIIGQPRLRIEIQSNFDVVVFDLEGLRKTCQSSEPALGQLLAASTRLMPQ